MTELRSACLPIEKQEVEMDENVAGGSVRVGTGDTKKDAAMVLELSRERKISIDRTIACSILTSLMYAMRTGRDRECAIGIVSDLLKVYRELVVQVLEGIVEEGG